jgi:uroporphyrinogen decarboxylase
MATHADQMTLDERLKAILNREPTDRIPIWTWNMGFSVVQENMSIADFYNKPQESHDAQLRVNEKFGFQDLPWIGYAAIGGWEFGGEIKWPTGEFAQAPTVLKYPVETVEDVWALKAPDPKTAGIIPLMTEIAEIALKDGAPYTGVFVQGPFTTAGNIPGMDRFAKWLMKAPDAVHRLMRLSTDFQKGVAEYCVEKFGAENIITFAFEPSASNQLIAPKHFEAFAFPYIKEQHERLLALGIKHLEMHICGEQNKNLPLWSQVPMGDPGMVSFGHEVDLETASEYFPTDIIIGNVEPALILTETPERIREVTWECLEKGSKHPGGFMLGAGCELPPNASAENVWAMVNAVRDFGLGG